MMEKIRDFEERGFLVPTPDMIKTIPREKNVKRKRLNRDFIIGGLCIILVLLDHQFGILSLVFRAPIDSFVAGALTGLGLLFEFVGFYNNNHEVSLKQRKQQLLMRK